MDTPTVIQQKDTRPDDSGRLKRAASSLPCKAIVFMVVMVVTVTAAVSGYLLRSSAVLTEENQHQQIAQLGAVLAKAAAHPFDAGDMESLQHLAEKSSRGDSLVYALFYNQDFHEVAGAERAGSNILDLLRQQRAAGSMLRGIPEAIHLPAKREVALDVIYPVRTPQAGVGQVSSPDRLLGYVRIGMATSGWYRSLDSRVDLLIGSGVLIALIAIPLGFVLIRWVVSPMERLNEAMVRFSHGEWNVRSSVTRGDEIGRLARTFNRMADLHQQTHERIVSINNQLEERVALRTRQLRELASREPLTGLYNRRHFGEVLEQHLSEVMRYNGELSCVMIDLDYFKQVNDRFGHHAGDEVLLLAAQTITSELRSADVAARYGGDEFILLLPQTGAERAAVLAQRLAERFEEVIAQRMPDVRTRMSFGIGSLRAGEVADAETLIRSADRALYRAKAASRRGSATSQGVDVQFDRATDAPVI